MRILTIIRVGRKATVTYMNNRRVLEVKEFDAAMPREDIERAIASQPLVVRANAAAAEEHKAPVAPPPPAPPASDPPKVKKQPRRLKGAAKK